jgi:hypothetical protein
MSPRLATAASAALALISLLTTGAGSLARGVEIPLPRVTMVFSQSITPRKLSRTDAMPIALKLSGRIGTVDGSQPPAVKEFVLDLDRSIAIDAHGLPVCQGGGRDFRFSDLKSRCKEAIVGRGKVGLQVQLPGQPPASAESELIVFNGGDPRTGKTTLYAVAFITEPITSSFTMDITITKRQGQSRAIIKVPKFANGAGSLTDIVVTMKKRFARNGGAVDFLTGSCPDGTLQSSVRALFADGTTLQGDALQKCIPKSD